jgi:hypothetical protein
MKSFHQFALRMLLGEGYVAPSAVRSLLQDDDSSARPADGSPVERAEHPAPAPICCAAARML